MRELSQGAAGESVNVPAVVPAGRRGGTGGVSGRVLQAFAPPDAPSPFTFSD
jgi:hypothetical protein